MTSDDHRVASPSPASVGAVAAVADLPLGPAHTVVTREGRLHLAYIDGLRALAALYVVSVHLLPRAWGQHRPESPVLRLLAKLTSGGHFAVTTFIVISGFCLMLPVTRSSGSLKGGAKVFFTRRFWRIAPPLYLVFLLSCAVLQLPRVHALYGPASHVTWRQWLAHLLLVQFPTPGGMLPNAGILWSISVECVMYLFFPFFVLCSRRAGSGG